MVRNTFREEMMKGTVLISPEDTEDYFAFFVKSQILDNRPSREGESVADEQLKIIIQHKNGYFSVTSPGKYIDLHAPNDFAKPATPPNPVEEEAVVQWSFNNITQPQFEDTRDLVEEDIRRRKDYLETAFTNVILETL